MPMKLLVYTFCIWYKYIKVQIRHTHKDIFTCVCIHMDMYLENNT